MANENTNDIRKSVERYITIDGLEIIPRNALGKSIKLTGALISIGDEEAKARRRFWVKNRCKFPQSVVAFRDQEIRLRFSFNHSTSFIERLRWINPSADAIPDVTMHETVLEVMSSLDENQSELFNFPNARSMPFDVSLSVSYCGFFEELSERADKSLRLLKQKSDANLLPDDVEKFKGFLNLLTDNADATRGFIDGLKGIAKVHPIAQAAASVVLLPFQLIQNEHIFTGRLKELVTTMKMNLEILNAAKDIATTSFGWQTIRSTMKDYLQFQTYVCKKTGKNGLKYFMISQVGDRKLDKFVKTFENGRKLLFDAIRLQVAQEMKEVIAEQKKLRLEQLLDPVTTPSPKECSEGTRDRILQQIKEWMRPSEGYKSNNGTDEPKRKILWISGEPGVGKSAISSSTARYLKEKFQAEHENPFAVFYINHITSNNPQSVWRTIAYWLAIRYPRYRDLISLPHFEGSKNENVIRQFEDLIDNPFKKLHEDPCFRISQVIPVVIIDALDECLSGDGSEGARLLDTIVKWDSLPPFFKLIVFSRRDGEIVSMLDTKDITNKIILPSGRNVDSEASQGIQKYLREEFQSISKKHNIGLGEPRDPWPGSTVVGNLVEYSAGLFVFPSSVIQYVGGRGGEPIGRLHDVLLDMKHFAGRTFEPIKVLYARILVETHSLAKNDDESNSMCLVLAFLVFQQNPLPQDQLIDLLAPIVSDSKKPNPFPITSAINNLMPIIAKNSTKEDDDLVRCNHRIFSEVLNPEDPKSLVDWFQNYAKSWSGEDAYREKIERFRKELLPKLTPSAQCFCLAHACLNALNAELKFQFSSPYKEAETTNREMDVIPPFLHHASKHWQEYSELAGEESDDLPLHPYKHALRWMESFSLIAKENDSESGQQKDLETRFVTCQESLEEDLRRRDRDTDGSQTPRHLAESEHHGILFDPKIQLGDEACKSNSTDIQETERRELEQLLGPCFQVLPRGCHEGTRVSILDRIKKWVKDSVPANPNVEFVGESANSPFAGAGGGPRDSPTSRSNILWISGGVGTGKTTIASSVVALLNSTEFSDVISNAQFFISYGVDDDPRLVWRTIAFQLALSSPAYRSLLLESGVLNMGTKDMNVKDQFEVVIKTLLLRLNISIVIVIDALDECVYGKREDFLNTVGDWKSLPSSCRLIVASRNNNDIARELEGTYHINLESNDGSKEIMDDIRFIFVDAFENVERRGWPEDGKIDELVKYSEGSFLWASTFNAFLVNCQDGDPRSRLDDVLRAFRDCDSDSNALRLLCAHILMHAHSHLETDDERECMFLVLAFLTFQKTPLSRRELGELLVYNISIILENLSPILIFGAPDEVVEFTHSYYRSVIRNVETFPFPDFARPISRHISRSKQSLCIAHACLRFMKESLAAQVDERHKSATSHHSVNTTRMEGGDPANVSSALKYACLYWVDHMDDIGRLSIYVRKMRYSISEIGGKSRKK